MGDPKKIRKQYSTPIHPWQKARIDEEQAIIKEFGLTNKREIWRQASKVRGFARQAKHLIANTSAQGQKEKDQLIAKLISLNILKEGADIDDVLELGTKDLMERRLQTLVYKKGLAKSIKQARQLIVHGHIMLGKSRVTIPSYMVKKEEESMISFVPTSRIAAHRDEEKAEGEAK